MNAPPWFDVPIDERTVGRQLAARLADSPARTFVRDESGSWTFAEVDALSREFARGLLAQGVERGDHVALMLSNRVEFVFAWFGVALVGAVVIPLDPRLAGSLVDYMLRDAAPRLLVIGEELLTTLMTAPPEVLDAIQTVVVVPSRSGRAGSDSQERSAGAGTTANDVRGNGITARNVGNDQAAPLPVRCLAWQAMMLRDGIDPERSVSGREIAMVMYTSGSTGLPKGVVMTSAHTFSSGIVMVRGVALQPDDVIFAPLPMFHGMSSRIGVFPALVTGASVFIASRFSASGYWRQAADCGGTVGLVVPTMPSLLMAQPPGPEDRAHRLRALFNAPYIDGFDERFGTTLVESFGMTEISHVISAALHERRPGSCGRIQPGWDVRLLEDDGNDVAPGEIGEIVARPHDRALMLQGYLNKPEATREAIRDGWFHTADYGRFAKDGYFYYASRKAERIRKLGENISAQEIEGVVMAHPAIAECAAVPRRTATGDDDVRIVVVVSPGASIDAADLHSWLKDRLPRFMVPRFIDFTDALPRTASGKVAKRPLIDRGLTPGTWDSVSLTQKATT